MIRKQLVALGTAGAVTLMLGLSPLGSASARAAGQEGTRAVCHFEAHETTTEGGNRITPGPARNETLQPGRINCVGTMEGRSLAEESGTISYWYVGGTEVPATLIGGESCGPWGGHGEVTVTLPLADSDHMTLKGKFTSRGVGVAGLMLGRLGDIDFSGPIHFRPDPDYLDEDCVRKPLNHFFANGEIVMTS